MAEPVTIDLFVEDRGHEEFINAVVKRVAAELEIPVQIRIRSARGGHGRVLEELRFYQATVAKSLANLRAPDVLVVAVDANCERYHRARSQIRTMLTASFRDNSVVACPDPHVERWYLADTAAFAKVVGSMPRKPRRKCEKDRYKALLAQAVVEGGHIPTLGGIEFAAEIVAAMDWYRACKEDASLNDFLTDLKIKLERTSR